MNKYAAFTQPQEKILACRNSQRNYIVGSRQARVHRRGEALHRLDRQGKPALHKRRDVHGENEAGDNSHMTSAKFLLLLEPHRLF